MPPGLPDALLTGASGVLPRLPPPPPSKCTTIRVVPAGGLKVFVVPSVLNPMTLLVVSSTEPFNPGATPALGAPGPPFKITWSVTPGIVLTNDAPPPPPPPGRNTVGTVGVAVPKPPPPP